MVKTSAMKELNSSVVKHEPYKFIKIIKPLIIFMAVFSLYKFFILGHLMNAEFRQVFGLSPGFAFRKATPGCNGLSKFEKR